MRSDSRWWKLALCLALSAPAAVAADRKYVGSEVCAGCHEQHPRWVAGSPHQQAAVPSGIAKGQSGCETCHGPGSEHSENPTLTNIVTFRLEEASARSAQCLACHSGSNPNRQFRRSDHATGKVPCDECHTPKGSENFHRMRVVRDTMAGVEPELCYRCHGGQRAIFALPHRHPLERGFMACSSCHQPHGTFTLRQARLRASEAICGKCHEEMQGPFVFEHPPGRVTGCESCHQPHGSTNPKMLTRAQVRFLCLECHNNITAFHDQTKAIYQNCTVCHRMVHGSNLDRKLFE